MLQKTREYEMFSFRDDNREKINQYHVKRLMESIKARNLLELRPILVNEKFEIIDGQHRLLAAKNLGVEIYYKVEHGLNSAEIMIMNMARNWIASDFLNYYCCQGNQNYLQLREFMKKNQLPLRVALTMIQGDSTKRSLEFKDGKFEFKNPPNSLELQICHETIDYIKKMNGFSHYTHSSRFWKALRKLVNHANFDDTRWKENLSKMVERFQSKPTTEDYCRLLMDVFNYRSSAKVNLLEEEF